MKSHMPLMLMRCRAMPRHAAHPETKTTPMTTTTQGRWIREEEPFWCCFSAVVSPLCLPPLIATYHLTNIPLSHSILSSWRAHAPHRTPSPHWIKDRLHLSASIEHKRASKGDGKPFIEEEKERKSASYGCSECSVALKVGGSKSTQCTVHIRWWWWWEMHHKSYNTLV